MKGGEECGRARERGAAAEERRLGAGSDSGRIEKRVKEREGRSRCCCCCCMGMRIGPLPIMHEEIETQKPSQVCTLKSDTSQKCLNHSLHGLEGGRGDRSHIGDGRRNAIPGSRLRGESVCYTHNPDDTPTHRITPAKKKATFSARGARTKMKNDTRTDTRVT